MKNQKKKRRASSLDDIVKAMRRGNREAEQEVLGPGFHAKHKVHTSSKNYSRRPKHRKGWDE